MPSKKSPAPAHLERLHKFIASTGRASRRKAEELIAQGRVEVNGERVTTLGTKIDPRRDRVKVDGEGISRNEAFTILLNKPAGIITTRQDEAGRKTVLDLLPHEIRSRGVLPAGRLDRDTEGLLVLTNQGELIQRLTHPRHETEKEYIATIPGVPTEAVLDRLRTGVIVDGRRTAPARVKMLRQNRHGARLSIVIREGRKRQVRRMLEIVGHPVSHLRRVRVAQLRLGDLEPGAWRELERHELELLERMQAPPTRKRNSKQLRFES